MNQWFLLAAAFLAALGLGACVAAPRRSPPAGEDRRPPAETRAPPEVPFGPPEARATWVVAHTLATREQVREVVDQAREGRLNALFVQVRPRGDAWYTGGIEPRATRIREPGFDPLAEIIEYARPDIQVHAWINVALVADADQPHPDPRHVTHARPDWLSVPRDLAAEAAALPAADPRITALLADYGRRQKSTVEGIFADLGHPEYRAHVVRVVEHLSRAYALDGVHFDYVRYANERFGYSRAVLAEFRASVLPDLKASERAETDTRLRSDPAAYVKRYPQRFAAFRQGAVTAFVRDAARAARTARPGIRVSAAVFPDAEQALLQRMQDWPRWCANGDLDVVCPMIYTADPSLFRRQLEGAAGRRGRSALWAGIGAWLLTGDEVQRRIDLARTLCSGAVLFSHHAVVAQPEGGFGPLARGVYQLRARMP